jgi:aldose 1-epimerase
MYQLDVAPFGNLEKLTFYNPNSGNRFSILPDFGAVVSELVFRGTPVLDGYATPDHLEDAKWKKSGILFPFPNRLKDGKYEWQGKTYQFPINDPDTHSALHGLSREQAMTVEAICTEEHLASVTCRYLEKGTSAAYPFPFTLSVTYQIEEPANFTLEMRFRNDGDTPIPVGFGWHPYFQLSEKTDDLQLQLPLCKWVEFDERKLPTGKREPYLEFSNLTPIGDSSLDNCFAVNTDTKDQPNKIFVTLQGECGTLRYWQETGPGKFNFLQIFIPEHRTSIGIEPMTCVTDGFNSGEGLIVSAPQQVAHARAGVEWV